MQNDHPVGMSLSHLRRSGGHAIALWLMGHFKKSALSNANKWGSPKFKITTWMLDDAKKTNKDGTVRRSTKPMEQRVHRDSLFNDGIKKDLMLVSYEDPNVYSWDPVWVDEEFGPVMIHHNILVIRSFYNHIASRIAYMDTRTVFASPGYKPDRIQWWIDHAKKSFDPSFTVIHFDKWFQSSSYRRTVEQTLGLLENDSNLQTVGSDGSGSSFTKTRMHGGAQNMKVLERWREVNLPPEVLENDEARELNRVLFGWTLDKNGNLCP